MPKRDERELESFESELRRFRPRAVTPLPLRSALSNWTSRIAAAAAALMMFVVVALWLSRSVHQPRLHRDAFVAEPLTRIRARAALAQGADVDDLAPLPIRRQQVRGISAFEVLSQE